MGIFFTRDILQYMIAWLSQYYGIDLLATVITFAGIWLLGNKYKLGFLFAFSGNILWLVIGLMIQSSGLLIANIGLALLNVRGYVKWRRAQEEAEDRYFSAIADQRIDDTKEWLSSEEFWAKVGGDGKGQ